MREFECRHDDVEVRGGVVDAFLSAFGPYKARGERVMCRHLGIERVDPSPDTLYPLAEVLRAMSELQDQFGGPFMRKIGAFIFDKAIFPPGIDSVAKGMELLNDAYYANHVHATGKIGGYYWTSGGEREGTMVCDNPYPCAFDIGILDTISKRFAPTAVVTHEEPELCRHTGGDRCRYHVRW